MKIRFRVVVVKATGFDLKAYNVAQQMEAITSSLNWSGTMEEHHCDAREIARYPKWLVEHFITHGGAEWAEREMRPKFVREIEIPLQVYILNRFPLLRRLDRETRQVFGQLVNLSRRVGFSRPVRSLVTTVSRYS